jgi:zinc transporter
MYILSLVTVIFMPLTFLTGLLGVNLGGIPGGNNVTGFLSFVILLGGVGILELIFLRRKKWF